MFDNEGNEEVLSSITSSYSIRDRRSSVLPISRDKDGLPFALLTSTDPEFAQEIAESRDVETARKRLQQLTERREAYYHSLECRIEDLERVNAISCLRILRNLLSERNERNCKCSCLEEIFEASRIGSVPYERQALFLDVLHILEGTLGKSGIYFLDEPADTITVINPGQDGRFARLDDLAFRCLTRAMSYPCGLDPSVVRRREANRFRVLEAMGGKRSDWDDYHWHLDHVARSLDIIKEVIELDPMEEEAIVLANENRVPFGITPYYLSLMDQRIGEGYDRAVRAQVIPKLDYLETIIPARKRGGEELDFMQEHLTTPVDLVTRRYPLIAIFKPYNSCAQICSYCQRNWEIEGPLDPNALASPEQMERAFKWFESNPLVQEVLITGGDPLVMSDPILDRVLSRFSRMRHIRRIRIGTRLPVVLPMRFTRSMLDTISRYHRPPEREVCLVTHFEQAYEVTPEAAKAVRDVRHEGMMLYNQQVFTFENCRRFETVALRMALKQIGVDPYYLFNTKGKEETRHFRVPIARILQEIKEEARLIPGIARTDEPVFNIPALGKNHLRAWQHHDLVMISPEGERMYEFHPWEKNISLAPTYLYRDVPIVEFLERLATRGEDPAEYQSIWYYF